ncbi:carboxylesterase [Nereida sp. MMG025]|uniref:alpha/beta hydrolase n=1 Tax=Nereida sp. MMG025 TaxID=2909981 RepID=UPI001F2AA1EF|nr:alpha/beta fold hydrolase [Nereida sp. MMG025]MCF6443861.1 alpha/beta fold hydrolase [Nereida sp. MMG025]
MQVHEVDAFLAKREADVPHLRPDQHKRVIWADKAGQRTPISVVFVHGFSASSGELQPLCEIIAQALGANLHYTRLAGHGQDGAAMGQATWTDWMADTDEALAVGRAIGERVVVVSCSTGGTLVTLALARQARDIAATVFVSPNYGMTSVIARALLAAPFVRRWGPILLGAERGFEAANPRHATYWTLRYPTKAVFAMDDAVRACRGVDVSTIKTPACFVFSEKDRVVDPSKTRAVAAAWGGPAEVMPQEARRGDDENAHVLAGDALSPLSTEPIAEAVLRWLEPHV